MGIGEIGAMAPSNDPTALAKHSLVVAGHRTSISLENAFWQALQRAAAMREVSLAALVAEIDATRGSANLSSAIRVYLLTMLTEQTGQ
jgi:predicted DNA-binding ribbon-helix-helix protein